MENITIPKEAIERLAGYAQKRQLYVAAIKEVTTKIEILDDEFKTRYDHNPIHHIESRLKSPFSIIEKLERKGIEPSMKAAQASLYDIAGIRIICCYLDDCYSMAKMLLRQNDITLIKQTDYIKSPKSNGYRSLHLIISIPVFLSDSVQKVPVEIQIRTIGMDFWASLDHELRYKSDHVSEEAPTRLKVCADKMAELDLEMQYIRHLIIEHQCEESNEEDF